jgi:hypothetical protein
MPHAVVVASELQIALSTRVSRRPLKSDAASAGGISNKRFVCFTAVSTAVSLRGVPYWADNY